MYPADIVAVHLVQLGGNGARDGFPERVDEQLAGVEQEPVAVILARLA